MRQASSQRGSSTIHTCSLCGSVYGIASSNALGHALMAKAYRTESQRQEIAVGIAAHAAPAGEPLSGLHCEISVSIASPYGP